MWTPFSVSCRLTGSGTFPEASLSEARQKPGKAGGYRFYGRFPGKRLYCHLRLRRSAGDADAADRDADRYYSDPDFYRVPDGAVDLYGH